MSTKLDYYEYYKKRAAAFKTRSEEELAAGNKDKSERFYVQHVSHRAMELNYFDICSKEGTIL